MPTLTCMPGDSFVPGANAPTMPVAHITPIQRPIVELLTRLPGEAGEPRLWHGLQVAIRHQTSGGHWHRMEDRIHLNSHAQIREVNEAQNTLNPETLITWVPREPSVLRASNP